MCCDELRGVGLLPSSPEPIRIDRFIEKRFNVSPQYEDLPDGVLGFTRFGKNGVKAVVISAALDAEGGKVAARRVRTTIAHEGGHGLLHAHLFALDEIPLHLFDQDSHSGDQILCRDVHGDEKKAHRYDGRWWEVQANRAMSSLLCPRPLVQEAMKPFLVACGTARGGGARRESPRGGSACPRRHLRCKSRRDANPYRRDVSGADRPDAPLKFFC